MKKVFLLITILFLFFPCFQTAAQNSHDSARPVLFSTRDLPQWASDLRRWDIVAFGTFPFSMFAVTFITDMIRWNNANGMDFSDRRYAPWPIKSPGAPQWTGQDYQRTILLAMGLSMTVAFVDFFIVRARRNNDNRRADGVPPGSVIIDRRPDEITGPDEPEIPE